MKSLVLETQFSSAHFYHQPQWSQEKNKKIFGRCFTDYGHGHNYKLRAEWGGVSEKQIPGLRETLEKIVTVLDHEHLNFVVPEFKNQVPTTEVILQYLEKKILERQPSVQLLNLELFETHDIGSKLRG